METKNLIKNSLLNAFGTAAYITLVALVLRIAEKYLSDKPDTFFAPIAFLLLFVTSAAITGGLVIGRPLLLYLSNQKQDAVKLFIYTVVWLLVFTFLALSINLILGS